MNEDRFWALIEEIWQALGKSKTERNNLLGADLSEDEFEDLNEVLDNFIPALSKKLNQLPADELLTFDRILERKLYELDRDEVQQATDGSDDAFLYARGFIVAMGEDFFNAINNDPDQAIMDMECESMCYLSFHIYREKFGEVPPSGISRESCSNQAGWQD